MVTGPGAWTLTLAEKSTFHQRHGVTTSSSDLSRASNLKRKSGGLAVICRRNYEFHVYKCVIIRDNAGVLTAKLSFLVLLYIGLLVGKTTIIAIAGPSASGKSLFASTVYQELVAELGGERISVLSEDAYYRDQSHLQLEQRVSHQL